MKKNMSQEEFERFEPKGNFPPKEPHEPFSPDEMLEPNPEGSSPSLAGFHMPKPPLTKKKLVAFLMELKPLVEHIQEMSRKDQHRLAGDLQEVKNELHAGDFSEEILRLFEKITEHFNDLLTHSTPLDQKGVLEAIHELESKL